MLPLSSFVTQELALGYFQHCHHSAAFTYTAHSRPSVLSTSIDGLRYVHDCTNRVLKGQKLCGNQGTRQQGVMNYHPAFPSTCARLPHLYSISCCYESSWRSVCTLAGIEAKLMFFLAIISACTELGTMIHPCEGDLVCKCTNEKVPYFNAPVFLENKSQIGKVDEIFGPMNDFVSSPMCKIPENM